MVAVVSDHGFANVGHDVKIGAAFVQAGLITLNEKDKPIAGGELAGPLVPEPPEEPGMQGHFPDHPEATRARQSAKQPSQARDRTVATK